MEKNKSYIEIKIDKAFLYAILVGIIVIASLTLIWFMFDQLMIATYYMNGYDKGITDGKFQNFNELFDMIEKAPCGKELTMTKLNNETISFRSANCIKYDGSMFMANPSLMNVINYTPQNFVRLGV